MRTYWIYQGSQPIHSVRLPKGASDAEVRCKAFDETDKVPGIVCNLPHETPEEHRQKIRNGVIVRI